MAVGGRKAEQVGLTPSPVTSHFNDWFSLNEFFCSLHQLQADINS